MRYACQCHSGSCGSGSVSADAAYVSVESPQTVATVVPVMDTGARVTPSNGAHTQLSPDRFSQLDTSGS